MDPTNRIIDLHTHSTSSDGQYPADVLAGKVAAAGTYAWALTDHDTVAGLEKAAARARELGLKFVPGIELSAFLDGGREVHVLGHFVDPASPELRAFEDKLADHRRGRVRRIVERLSRVGVRIREEDIVALSGGKTIGRPHVAMAMVDAGAVSTVKEAFDRYLGEGKPAFEGRFRLTAEEAVALIRESGGTATLAHPGVNKVQPLELARLRQMGFAGVEADHPEHPPEQAARFRAEAARADLVCTAGSDFHGEVISPDRYLGSSRMTAEALDQLEARRPSRTPRPASQPR